MSLKCEHVMIWKIYSLIYKLFSFDYEFGGILFCLLQMRDHKRHLFATEVWSIWWPWKDMYQSILDFQSFSSHRSLQVVKTPQHFKRYISTDLSLMVQSFTVILSVNSSSGSQFKYSNSSFLMDKIITLGL